jgi:hypothetical protein
MASPLRRGQLWVWSTSRVDGPDSSLRSPNREPLLSVRTLDVVTPHCVPVRRDFFSTRGTVSQTPVVLQSVLDGSTAAIQRSRLASPALYTWPTPEPCRAPSGCALTSFGTARQHGSDWVLCHEHGGSTRRCATVLEMEEGPSGSVIRSPIPSHRERLWSKDMVVSIAEKAGTMIPKVRSREASASEPLQKRRKRFSCHGQLGHPEG